MRPIPDYPLNVFLAVLFFILLAARLLYLAAAWLLSLF
jgi:hypothetical protein